MLPKISLPKPDSHKGQNGKVMVIGGSRLFHGASFWALKVLTRLVDMVFFASVPEVECVVNALKSQLWDFIYIPRPELENYIKEADVVLIGLGMTREKKNKKPNLINHPNWRDTYEVVSYLTKKYPHKKWLLDAGALQVISPADLSPLDKLIITPHATEFQNLFKLKLPSQLEEREKLVQQIAKQYRATILLKGRYDIVSDGRSIKTNKTGNPGMTKGGTGDVLAGLVAGLWVKNPPLTAAWLGAYINGLAGDNLYQKVGPFYNASDLSDEVVKMLWQKINNEEN